MVFIDSDPVRMLKQDTLRKQEYLKTYLDSDPAEKNRYTYFKNINNVAKVIFTATMVALPIIVVLSMTGVLPALSTSFCLLSLFVVLFADSFKDVSQTALLQIRRASDQEYENEHGIYGLRFLR